MAKCERLGFIASAGAIVDRDLDANDSEPERILRRYLLDRATDAELTDPTTPTDKALTRSARKAT